MPSIWDWVISPVEWSKSNKIKAYKKRARESNLEDIFYANMDSPDTTSLHYLCIDWTVSESIDLYNYVKTIFNAQGVSQKINHGYLMGSSQQIVCLVIPRTGGLEI